jgi:hypothetical protein
MRFSILTSSTCIEDSTLGNYASVLVRSLIDSPTPFNTPYLYIINYLPLRLHQKLASDTGMILANLFSIGENEEEDISKPESNLWSRLV